MSVPVKSLFAQIKVSKPVSTPTCDGIGPPKRLFPSPRYVINRLNRPIVVGIVPVSSLQHKPSSVSFVNRVISAGIVPTSPLLRQTIWVAAVKSTTHNGIVVPWPRHSKILIESDGCPAQIDVVGTGGVVGGRVGARVGAGVGAVDGGFVFRTVDGRKVVGIGAVDGRDFVGIVDGAVIDVVVDGAKDGATVS